MEEEKSREMKWKMGRGDASENTEGRRIKKNHEP